MTEITLNNFETKVARYGIVASMNIRIGNMLTIMGCALMRPEADPDYVHVMPPRDARSGEGAVKLSPNLMTELNGRAAMLYAAATGIKVRGSAHRADIKPKLPSAPVPEPAVEDDDAGMRRVIGETMEAAGL